MSLPERRVGEGPVEGDPLQLPRNLLVEGADPNVANTLSIDTVKIESITSNDTDKKR